MADPQAATLTQLRNIQARTGKTIAELHAVLAASGLARTGERRSLLMEQFRLGYGDANTVALFYTKPVPALDGGPPPAAPAADAAGDPLDALYVGAKAPLRALHEAVIRQVRGFGEFAVVGPATKDLIEIGINARDLAPGARLKTMPVGGMCPYTLRIAGPGDIDAELTGWLRTAYDAAG